MHMHVYVTHLYNLLLRLFISIIQLRFVRYIDEGKYPVENSKYELKIKSIFKSEIDMTNINSLF